MFWWSYFPVKSHLSLFIVRYISFLIWCVSQSFSSSQACPISLLSINLLLTNIILNLVLLSHFSFIVKTSSLTLRFHSLLIFTTVFFSLEHFSIYFLSVSFQICSFFFSSGTPSHTWFLLPQDYVWNIAGFWETIHITSNTAEICWQAWNYVEISFKEAIRYPKAHSASVSRGKKQIHWLLLLFTVSAYKTPQIWQCVGYIHFKSMVNMLCFFPKHHQMCIPLLEICPLNNLFLLNSFN